MRRRGRIDASQRGIIEALRAAGCTVVSLANVGNGCPDLLIGYGGRTTLLEVKSPRARYRQGKVENATRDRQVQWADRWRGDTPWTVMTVDGALKAVGVSATVRIG